MDPTDVLADPVAALGASDSADRRLALSVLATQVDQPGVTAAVVARLQDDLEPAVRAAAVEILAGAGPEVVDTVMGALDDPDRRVVEAAVTALGEMEAAGAVGWLLDAVTTHPERLVQEAAVAALGAIGDPEAIPLLLDVVATGPPQVRRRAVVALTVFDDPAVEPALRRATEDRNPMVREVAELVLGRRPDDGWEPLDLKHRA